MPCGYFIYIYLVLTNAQLNSEHEPEGRQDWRRETRKKRVSFVPSPFYVHTNDACVRAAGFVTVNVCLVSASILHDLSDMQPQINAIKIEHPPYYCSSYTPPSAATAADHAQPAANFSEFYNSTTFYNNFRLANFFILFCLIVCEADCKYYYLLSLLS